MKNRPYKEQQTLRRACATLPGMKSTKPFRSDVGSHEKNACMSYVLQETSINKFTLKFVPQFFSVNNHHVKF